MRGKNWLKVNPVHDVNQGVCVCPPAVGTEVCYVAAAPAAVFVFVRLLQILHHQTRQTARSQSVCVDFVLKPPGKKMLFGLGVEVFSPPARRLHEIEAAGIKPGH